MPTAFPPTGDVASSTATINLDPGETVRCTYTNQPGGSVVIKKAVASGPSGPFTFLDNIQTPATFELSDGGEQRFDGVLPGTYTVQESAFPDGSGLAQHRLCRFRRQRHAIGQRSRARPRPSSTSIPARRSNVPSPTRDVAPAAPAVGIAASGTQGKCRGSGAAAGHMYPGYRPHHC